VPHSDDHGKFYSGNLQVGRRVTVSATLHDGTDVWTGQYPDSLYISNQEVQEVEIGLGHSLKSNQTGGQTPKVPDKNGKTEVEHGQGLLISMVRIPFSRPLLTLASYHPGGFGESAPEPQCDRTVAGKVIVPAGVSPDKVLVELQKLTVKPAQPASSKAAPLPKDQAPPAAKDNNEDEPPIVVPLVPDSSSFSQRVDIGDYMLTVASGGYIPELFAVRVSDAPAGCVEIFDFAGKPADLSAIQFKPHVESSAAENARRSDISSARRALFTGNLLEQLPLEGVRNLDNLVLLAPGVAPPPEVAGQSGPSVGPGLGTAGQFSINGLRSRGNYFSLNGSDDNDEEAGVRRQGFVTPFPTSVDSVVEMQVIAALADARYGRATGGQINAVTHPGLSQFHGTIYGFGTGGALQSRPFFDVRASGFPAAYQNQVPITTDGSLTGQGVQFQLGPGYAGPIQTNSAGYGFQPNPGLQPSTLARFQGGVTFSGPIIKDRTYFFAAFEDLQQNQTDQANFAVPTVAQRGFLGEGAAGVTFIDFPSFSQGPVLYPATLAGDGVYSLYPFPNNPLGPYGPNNYTTTLGANARAQLYSLRLDHRFKWLRKEQQLTGSYNGTRETNVAPSVGNALFSSVEPQIRTQDFVLSLTTAWTPNVSSEFRATFGQSSADFNPVRNSFLLPSSLAAHAAPSAVPDVPYLLNAPLLINTTLSPKSPSYVAANTNTGITAIESQGLDPATYNNSESLTGFLGQEWIAGYSPVGLDVNHFPQRRRENTFQLADTLSFNLGRHLLVVGVDARQLALDSYVDRNARPLAVFSGPQFAALIAAPGPGISPGGSPTSLAAVGVPTGLFQTLDVQPESTLPLRQWETDLFAQEYFKLNRLTFNVGVRTQLSALPSDGSHRLIDSFNPQNVVSQVNQATAACGSFGAAPGTYVLGNYPQLCAETAQDFESILTSSYNAGFGAHLRTVAPRAGFAWDALGSGRLVVRGGWGRFDGQFPAAIVNESRSAYPNYLPVNAARWPVGPAAYLDDVFRYQDLLANVANPNSSAFIGSPYLLQPGTLNVLQPAYASNSIETIATYLGAYSALWTPTQPGASLRSPYSFQSSVNVDIRLPGQNALNIAWVNTHGYRLLQVATPERGPLHFNTLSNLSTVAGNFLELVAGLFDTNFSSTNPTYAPTFFESSASSSYNALQVEYRRPLVHGVQVYSSFTWSHAIDNASDFFDTLNGSALPQNSAAPSERGDSDFDVRLRFTAAFVWELPLASGVTKGTFLDALLKDWSLSGISTQQTGQPFTVNSVYDANGDGNLTDRLTGLCGVSACLQLNNPDPRISVIDPPGGPGFGGPVTLGRNTFRASGLSDVDLAISRSIHAKEMRTLILRAEAFNVANHGNFGIPVRYLEAPGFGTAVNTITPPRTFQLSCRFSF
jgi:hypothetical protein